MQAAAAAKTTSAVPKARVHCRLRFFICIQRGDQGRIPGLETGMSNDTAYHDDKVRECQPALYWSQG